MNIMTLEYLELTEDLKRSNMEEVNKTQELEVQGASTPTRKKCIKSFKSNTRIFDDNSIEVIPKADGVPSQKDVKKVGRSKRYATTGKNPLTCVELKCPDDVVDKAAYFHKELQKLTKDIQISEPTLPQGEYLLNNDRLKVCFVKDQNQVIAWLTFEVKGNIDVRKELYQMSSEIDKCFVINSDLICPQQ